jgi:hypothetical protein
MAATPVRIRRIVTYMHIRKSFFRADFAARHSFSLARCSYYTGVEMIVSRAALFRQGSSYTPSSFALHPAIKPHAD